MYYPEKGNLRKREEDLVHGIPNFNSSPLSSVSLF